MDYKELLKKYILHVKDWEGISFIEYAGPFSAEELWELTVLAKETGKDDEPTPEVLVRSPQWVTSMQYALLHDLEQKKFKRELYGLPDA